MEYAKGTFVAPEWIRKRCRNCEARSFYGIPVESKNGLWGVIVIDSRNPTIDNLGKLKTLFTVIRPYLGKLLEKA